MSEQVRKNGNGDDTPRRFIGRQPILNAQRHVCAYELLFRAAAESTANTVDSQQAALSTLDLSLLLGAESLSESLPAFLNCTREVLCSGVASRLPADSVVLEILEDVPADVETVQACRQLKHDGYRLAMDDVVDAEDRPALMALAEIVKVDFLLTSVEQQQQLAQRLGRHGVQMLAEKVETDEQFRTARAMGYTLFQGYFFYRPVTLAARDLPSTHLGYLEILRQVYEPELNLLALERAIREEPALCYRLLRYLNAAAYGLYEVTSIVQALTLLGQDELRRWVSLVAAISLAGPHSADLLRAALLRARFGELYASSRRLASTEYFLTGLFSLLDALLDRPLPQLLERIALSPGCRAALGGESNRLRQVLDLSIACGRGEWEAMTRLCRELECSETEAWGWLEQSRRWVREMMARKDLAATPPQ